MEEELERAMRSSSSGEDDAEAEAEALLRLLRTPRGRPVEQEILLCDYCACFIKERTPRAQGRCPPSLPTTTTSRRAEAVAAAAEEAPALLARIFRGRKHGMQMAVEHVLSGGSMPAPSRPHFLRCLAILDRPDHPFLDAWQGELRDRLTARKVLFDEDCVVRWLFEGRQHVFGDAILAKNMRRWISDRMWQRKTDATEESEAELWDDASLPEACRFCCRGGGDGSSSSSSYCAVLLFGGGGEAQREGELLRVEQEAALAPHHHAQGGLFFFCVRCHRTTALSFQYHCALRQRLGLVVPDSAEAHYARLIALFRLRAAMLLQLLKPTA